MLSILIYLCARGGAGRLGDFIADIYGVGHVSQSPSIVGALCSGRLSLGAGNHSMSLNSLKEN